ncbi:MULTISPECIES: PAS domain S-box protein [Actinoplanes]|uniref:PAS domain S-box protein n=1 Tax=Actinoplanes TaxID=1865 RepID=UPI0006984F1D|nr:MULTISPECIES: PAS domain S-box protein [Actinoplanes]GLY02679.1 hypothetical protein Acsp01_30580 [Actinoplanes sp. NBRC 101535]
MGGNERARLAELHEYGLLDLPAGDELEALVRLAAAAVGVPYGTLNLIDENRQCQLTTVGFDGGDSARSDSMCAVHFQDGEPVCLADAREHPGYATNPWVTGILGDVRFYLSVPLVTPGGHALGTLCLFDTEPGEAGAERVARAVDAAGVVVAQFERRRQARINAELAAEADRQRERFAVAVRELEVRAEFIGAVLETIDVGIVAADRTGHLTLFNRASRDFHGLDADPELHPDLHAQRYGLFHADGVTPLGPADVPLARALHDGKVTDAEMVIAPEHGPAIRVLVSGRALVGSDGGVLGAVVVQRDITRERQVQTAVQAAQQRETERLRATITAQRELTAAATDRERVVRLVVDRTAAALPGSTEVIVSLLDDDGVLRVAAATPEVTFLVGRELDPGTSLTGTAMSTGVTRRCGDVEAEPGADRDTCRAIGIAALMVAPLFAGGSVIGAVTVGADHRHAFDENDEQQLTLLADACSGALRHAGDADRQAQLMAQIAERAQLLDLTQDAVIVRSLQGRIQYWNPAAERVYGWSAQVAAGHDVDRLLATTWLGGADRESVTGILLEQGEWEGELEHRRADGRRVTILSRQALQRDAAGRPAGVLSINTDISARRTAELALSASEERFRSQFTYSTVGQMIRGLDDTIEDVNPAFAAMLGYAREQLIGTTADRVYDPAVSESRHAALAAMFAGESDAVSAEGHLVRADGTLLDVHMNISAVRDSGGQPERFIGVYQDITDRRTAEAERDAAMGSLAAKNAQLEEANQLKLDLIGMLGHEIGNPLCAIIGNTETALDNWDDLPPARQRRLVEVVDRNAHRLDAIVREVLALVALDAGKLTAHPEPTPVRERLLAAVAASGDEPVLSGADGVAALVQPGHLDQIITNLLSNAAKYGGGATAVDVRRDGRTVLIGVTDEGAGVPEGFRPQLFERFARSGATAGRVRGTGLGLYIVRELARANRGDVTYRPRPGGGSVFTLALPAVP